MVYLPHTSRHLVVSVQASHGYTPNAAYWVVNGEAQWEQES
jgi:hypothetical protein